MSFVCKTCNKSFRSKSNLTAHIRTAKYCIKLRDSSLEVSVPIFTCDICDKTFNVKHVFQQHRSSCASHPGYVKQKEVSMLLQVENKQLKLQMEDKDKIFMKQLEDKDKMIDKMRSDLQLLSMEAVKRPSTVHNTNNNNNTHTTNINNLAVFSGETLNNVLIENPITKDTLSEGIPGVAKHMGNLLTTKFDKPTYTVSNVARQKFNYKDADGIIRKDFKAKAIINSVGSTLTDQATTHFNATREQVDLVSRINDIEKHKIPLHKKAILQFEEQIKESPYRRNNNHPDIINLREKIEETNSVIVDLMEQLEELKEEANDNNVRLDISLDTYRDDLNNTAQNLYKIKNINKEQNLATFSKTLIETLS
jgi:hypothetical protein